MSKTAFVTGISGQDGFYLSENLLGRGYKVFGLVRRTSQPPLLPPGVTPILGDVTDLASLIGAMEQAGPDEVYNLAAQSYIVASYRSPVSTAEINGIGAANVFEATRLVVPKARVYQAGTSEMFGGLSPGPYYEATPFHPRSPYAAAKVYAHHTAVHYRERYGMYVCNGILFNHESPKRGLHFVTRKITHGLARVRYGLQTCVTLGDLTPKRDWGFAGDYVEAMRLMLQQPEPDDYVVGTGVSHSVGEVVNYVCQELNLDPEGAVVQSEADWRPTDVPVLTCDPSKAREVLGWEPKVDFYGLLDMMIDHDLGLAEAEAGDGNG